MDKYIYYKGDKNVKKKYTKKNFTKLMNKTS